MHFSAQKIKVAAAAAAVVITALALTGCANHSSSTASTTFVMAQQSLPATLDPAAFSGGTRAFFATLDSSLVAYDDSSCSTAPSSDKLTGILAKSWTTSPDGKTITVTLRNLKSEWGNKLTAEDVKWSLERGRALSPIVGFLSSKSIHLNATDPITVKSSSVFTFNLDSPTPIDMAMWSVPSFTILDKTAVLKHATAADKWGATWLKTHTASFGPWKESDFKTGNTITLTQNAGYTESRGNIKTVIIKQVANAADQASLVQTGAVNYARNLTWDQFKSLQGNSKVTVNNCASISRDWLILQQKDPRFANVQVRQAISMAIDRSALVQGALAGFGTVSKQGFLPGDLPKSSDLLTLPDNDVAKAKSLLAAAGYADGFTFTLAYNSTQPGSEVDQLGVLLQSQLKQIGITVNLNPLTSGNDLQQAESTGAYEGLLWSSGSALPSSYFEAGLIEPGSPNNSWNYDSQEYVDLVNQLGAAKAGSAEADAIVVKLANINVNEIPVVQLVDTTNTFVLSSNVTDLNKALGTIMIQPDPAQLNLK